MFDMSKGFSLLLLVLAGSCLAAAASGCGAVTGCDEWASNAVHLRVVNQSGETLDVDQVSWSASNGKQGEANCMLSEQPCETWIIGREDRGEHDATFDITVTCGSETKQKTVRASGDYCHWDTEEVTLRFDDRESC